jgi:allophanate hydrolase
MMRLRRSAVLQVPIGPIRFSRARPIGTPGPMAAGRKVGVPLSGQRLFFGDRRSAAAFEAAVNRCADLGIAIVEIDIEPFYETARLLYDGPWVAERYITARSSIASSPESMHPVTRQIILDGARPTAVDTFAAFYQLEDLRASRTSSSARSMPCCSQPYPRPTPWNR